MQVKFNNLNQYPDELFTVFIFNYQDSTQLRMEQDNCVQSRSQIVGAALLVK
jgi:hypothetical protein